MTLFQEGNTRHYLKWLTFGMTSNYCYFKVCPPKPRFGVKENKTPKRGLVVKEEI